MAAVMENTGSCGVVTTGAGDGDRRIATAVVTGGRRRFGIYAAAATLVVGIAVSVLSGQHARVAAAVSVDCSQSLSLSGGPTATRGRVRCMGGRSGAIRLS